MGESYTEEFFTDRSMDAMIAVLRRCYPEFDAEAFCECVHDAEWDSLLIKGKMRHVTRCLHDVLPRSYPDAIEVLLAAAPEVRWWECTTFPDYVSLYGHDDWELSMEALAEFTKHGSSEFGVRPFLISEPERTATFLLGLTGHENEHVRRYASEGSRPRHPWAVDLPLFKQDPTLILPILERLKNDESEYVRRSVANSLNDISKDNPETVLELAGQWLGETPNTDKLIKHACRTLLKRGNRRAMELFGFGGTANLRVSEFVMDKECVTVGERVTLTYSLDVTGGDETSVRLEYGVHYLKRDGSYSRKVYKIAERTFAPGCHSIRKRHNFSDGTTRTHNEGRHGLSVIVNGEEMAKREFLLRRDSLARTE